MKILSVIFINILLCLTLNHTVVKYLVVYSYINVCMYVCYNFCNGPSWQNVFIFLNKGVVKMVKIFLVTFQFLWKYVILYELWICCIAHSSVSFCVSMVYNLCPSRKLYGSNMIRSTCDGAGLKWCLKPILNFPEHCSYASLCKDNYVLMSVHSSCSNFRFLVSSLALCHGIEECILKGWRVSASVHC